MLLEIVKTHSRKCLCLCKCDVCGIEFEGHYGLRNHDHHFHSKECTKQARKKGGVIHQATSATVFERWGVNNIAQSEDVKLRIETTNLERYGVTAAAKNSDVNAKRCQTLLEKYDVSETFSSAIIRTKARETKISRYNEEWPQKLDVVKDKARATCIERYDVPATLSSGSHFRASIDEYAKWGQQGYRSLITKRGNDALTIPEGLVGDTLKMMFGKYDIEQQVEVQHNTSKPWLIDYRIISLDLYLEVDGMFWHGLDNAYEKLHANQQVKYDADRVQDLWFENHDKLLVRVTDEWVIEHSKRNMLEQELRHLIDVKAKQQK